MNLAIGIILVWVGAALLWVSTHGTEAKTPWQVWEQITGAMGA